MPEIYHYLDYHQWLEVAFKQKKAEVPSFSHRFIARRLGLKSSGYILYVMQGKRKLTETMAIGIAQLFKLTKSQTDYFLQLIRYAHAKSSQEKQFQFERLIALRRKHVKNVEPEQYRFYEKWFYPVVREALALLRFTGDYAGLAAMITPPVTAAEAAEAVELLAGLGMVDRDENKVYHKKDAVISTGDVWQSAVIHAHQRELLGKGREALDTVPKSDRDISHLTITASKATLELIAQRIAHLRSEILEIARLEKEPDRVLQCNFMVFPAAMKKEGR
ncbi:MAG: TIGR02147 family protein [Chitinispirillaceae bacterium]|nr:TIGR02147 family protein [Chitinispirillaceae bacterium]